MKEFKYHLSVSDCRAIRSAEIELADITVLTGINASGKSTIARMFRDLVEMSSEYERLLAVKTWNSRMDVWRYLFSSSMRVAPKLHDSLRSVTEDLANGTLTFHSAVEMLDQSLRSVLGDANGSHMGQMFEQRARRLLNLENNTEDVYSIFKKEAARSLQKFEKQRKVRSYAAYQDLMKGNTLNEGRVTLTEGDQIVFSNESKVDTLNEISFIKRAIYIESPLKSFPRFITSTSIDMGDQFTRIKEDVAPDSVLRLTELNEILSGEFQYEIKSDDDGLGLIFSSSKDTDGWWYQRKDGQRFALEDCATGIKSLSILSVLHSHGWLDAETLLIIDEPEAHLHPQWVVEYARILLLLSKRLRVRIVITSHSPDMVNALHTIGLSLGMGGNLGFYLAEPVGVDDPYRFKFRGLGNKVGDVFKAYNVSFERIDDYAKRGTL